MSRIGKAPITVPSGVDINISGADVAVKGPKGELSHTLPTGIGAEIEEGILTVTRQKKKGWVNTTNIFANPGQAALFPAAAAMGDRVVAGRDGAVEDVDAAVVGGVALLEQHRVREAVVVDVGAPVGVADARAGRVAGEAGVGVGGGQARGERPFEQVDVAVLVFGEGLADERVVEAVAVDVPEDRDLLAEAVLGRAVEHRESQVFEGSAR